MATKKTEEEKTEEKIAKKNEELDPMRPVMIHLFKDSGKYKDDVVVGLNGKVWQIQRGVDVEIPWAVAQVLERHKKLQEYAADYALREQQNYLDAEKHLI